jgi:hypothetical protein
MKHISSAKRAVVAFELVVCPGSGSYPAWLEPCYEFRCKALFEKLRGAGKKNESEDREFNHIEHRRTNVAH